MRVGKDLEGGDENVLQILCQFWPRKQQQMQFMTTGIPAECRNGDVPSTVLRSHKHIRCVFASTN